MQPHHSSISRRNENNPTQRLMPKKIDYQKKSKVFFNCLIGNYPGRALHRIGTALVGIWLTSLMINLIWPMPDQSTLRKSLEKSIDENILK